MFFFYNDKAKETAITGFIEKPVGDIASQPAVTHWLTSDFLLLINAGYTFGLTVRTDLLIKGNLFFSIYIIPLV